jgi:Na+:H+ antiporter, NhaA family
MRASSRATWATSDRALARLIARPVARFLAVEAAGGVLLLAAAVAALVWANSPWSASYDQLWHTTVTLDAGPLFLSLSLQHWVNDGLMALFFFVVGLEIKRELVDGQLAQWREAALPAIAALGGMLVPVAFYAAVNAGGPGRDGWGIPMATDIAFAVGVLALLGPRVPAALKVLLLGLAVADDLGAIVVIAVAYTDDLEVPWLLAAVAGLVVIALLRRAQVWYVPVYAVLGLAVWGFTLESGVHATIAGVALGLLTPAKPLLGQPEAEQVAARLSNDLDVTVEDIRDISFDLRESVSVAERLEDLLHPWTSYLVIPIFALANTGIPLTADGIGDAATSPITAGIVLGLVIGKLLGVTAFAWLAVRFGIARLPDAVTWRHVTGMAALAGIGFTVSIFVTGVALADDLQTEAKIGVLVASVLAAGLGALLLRTAPSAASATRRRDRS